MAWRIATSLQVLLNEVNALYPERDKRTDGAISGYPGSVSSHNVNAAGVVCALDITTGDYPGGITMAQSYPLADAIRQELLVAPRGLYTYLIHHMEPPYVPSPGPYIAHGGQDSLWQWVPYTGTDPHTSHIHVSVDWDIPTGGAPSGQDPYDMTNSWNLGTSALSSTITPIQEGFLMALTDAEQAEVLAKSREMYELLAASKQGALADVFADHLMKLQVPKQGGGTTTLGIELGWTKENVASLANLLLPIAQGIGALKAQPAAAAPVIDVPALAAQIATALNTNQAHDFLVAFRNALPAQ